MPTYDKRNVDVAPGLGSHFGGVGSLRSFKNKIERIP
jgi:hypothetical protein